MSRPLTPGERRLPVGRAVRVHVPATSANLGPGFDSMGLALQLDDEVTLEVVEGVWAASVEGEGAESLPTDGSHLILRLAREHLAARGVTVPGLTLHAVNRIPHARGLGSSAAAVVAAIAGAEALLDPEDRLDADGLLGVCSALEGHPDNVAPALRGGATVSWSRGGDAAGEVGTAELSLHPGVVPVVAVPDVEVSTHAVRALLPTSVPHAEAAAQAGRAALLVHALSREPRLLAEATVDLLHQGPRSSAMPETAALITRLRAAGHAAVVSGAGPSVLVLAPGERAATTAAEYVRELYADSSRGWRVQVTGIARGGARVEHVRHG